MTTNGKKQIDDERVRIAVLTGVSFAEWGRLSGRRPNEAQRQLKHHGLIPQKARKIDLSKLAAALHEHFALNRVKLRKAEPLNSDSPALEQYRQERTKLVRLERQERERDLVPVEDLRQILGITASTMRRAHERLQRKFGEEAYRIVSEALDETERDIKAFCDD